ncbi:MAG: CapA family protein [Deltaproteobacteria bacterium]|nr:CapA family protein [Deltaproteobacteria bacterium]
MEKVKVFISGDFCPIEKAEQAFLREVDAAQLLGEFAGIIRQCDLAVTNLECPLTVSESAIPKIGPNLKAHPDVAKAIIKLGFNLVTLANNHIYDYGQEGLDQTLGTLRDNNIAHVGAGKELAEAQKIYRHEIKGIKIAIVNFAEVEFSCATDCHGGANAMDLIDNVHHIQEAKKNADHVIVIVHGGHEHSHYPSPGTLKRYRFIAEQGVSAVVGHHTHFVGGYEIYNDVPIFYSLGNFLFPRDNAPAAWHEGYAVLLKLSKDQLEFEMLPYEQCKGQTIGLQPQGQKSPILEKVNQISSALSDPIVLQQKWNEFIEGDRELYYLTKMSMLGRYQVAFLKRMRLLFWFLNKKKLRSAKQFLTCKAHREAALDVLESFLKEE